MLCCCLHTHCNAYAIYLKLNTMTIFRLDKSFGLSRVHMLPVGVANCASKCLLFWLKWSAWVAHRHCCRMKYTFFCHYHSFFLWHTSFKNTEFLCYGSHFVGGLRFGGKSKKCPRPHKNIVLRFIDFLYDLRDWVTSAANILLSCQAGAKQRSEFFLFLARAGGPSFATAVGRRKKLVFIKGEISF